VAKIHPPIPLPESRAKNMQFPNKYNGYAPGKSIKASDSIVSRDAVA
jgi:hypothetical protein